MREINEFIQRFIELTNNEIQFRERLLDYDVNKLDSFSDKKYIIYGRDLVNELYKFKNALQIYKLGLKRVNEDRIIE
jgi:hypothetical protein